MNRDINPTDDVIRIELRCGDNLLSPSRGWEMIDTLRRYGLAVTLPGGHTLPSRQVWPYFWLQGDHTFEGQTPALWNLAVCWSSDRSDPDTSMFLHLIRLRFQRGMEISRIEALFRDLVHAVDPLWGAALHPSSQPDEAHLNLLQWGLPGIFWQNYLSPSLVDWLGRERIANVPYGEGKLIPRRGARISCGFEPNPDVERRVRGYIGERFFSPDSFPTRTVQPPLPLAKWAFIGNEYLPGHSRGCPHRMSKKEGTAMIEQVFSVDDEELPIASCRVLSGLLCTGMQAQIQRSGRVVHRGAIVGLRRYRQRVDWVPKGVICGVSVEGAEQIAPHDLLICEG